MTDLASVNSVSPIAVPDSRGLVSVAIGQWALATAPAKLQTLLGSCVGVVLYHRSAKLGALAHIMLPSSPANGDHPGKYADTAIPAMLADIELALGTDSRRRLSAKLAGGASMFQIEQSALESSQLNIGQRNQETIERILLALNIPIVARDLGGKSGRRLIVDTTSGIVTIKAAGSADREL
jgi:chemotaxis protein CheD